LTKERKQYLIYIKKPDFAIKIAMRISNTLQAGVLGYFLAKETASYFVVKKCS